VFDPASERLVSGHASLSGTNRNCAGGPTPWNTWLSCEESLAGPGDRFPLPRQHGYVFEVPLTGASNAEPIKAMGCFVHEAAAVDPATGIVYQTQDRAQAGLYRFVPKTPGRLANGGRLQMLALDGRQRFDTSRNQQLGVSYPIHWEDIPDPDRAHDRGTDGLGVLQQGLDRGGATFSRLEGAWFGDGRLFVTATDGGNARMGQVWEINPTPEPGVLRLRFESDAATQLNMPDNVTVSPRGGLVLCENGAARVCSIHGLTRDGRIFRFARNNVRLAGERNGIRGDFTAMEFAGATFSPDGRWLFFNVQVPGITVAVTGPWGEGGL
jgi:secreted PhoX family phosphatase